MAPPDTPARWLFILPRKCMRMLLLLLLLSVASKIVRLLKWLLASRVRVSVHKPDQTRRGHTRARRSLACIGRCLKILGPIKPGGTNRQPSTRRSVYCRRKRRLKHPAARPFPLCPRGHLTITSRTNVWFDRSIFKLKIFGVVLAFATHSVTIGRAS